ncbi:MAG: L-threonylcarbamoyladenylate synthase [Acidimicrobiia bacterium]
MSLEEAVAVVRAGGVVGLPTDTVYGIGADPLNSDAVARLFELKGRPASKPIGLLVASIDQAVAVGEIEGRARVAASLHWPGALTLVVVPKVVMADWVGDSQTRTVGIRVPDHPLALELLARSGPLAVTSANASGQAEVAGDVDARAEFGEAVDVYLEGTSPGGEASTVVDATGESLAVLRKGPVEV